MWKYARSVHICLEYPSRGIFHSFTRVCLGKKQGFGIPCQFALPALYSGVRNSSHFPRVALTNGEYQRKKVTLPQLKKLYVTGEPITMLTAHDVPSASAADRAGIDVILVGDSLAMVALGLADTTETTMDEMLLHCKSVARGARSAFLVGDLPMGSYEISPEQAVTSAIRLMKEGRVNAVKIEGGRELCPAIKKITQAGIPVVGHIGLTPQKQNILGGFRVQGKNADSVAGLLRDALQIQDAGVIMCVLEAVPPEVASLITTKLDIPTIGIGAGSGCSGQVLVQTDMTGNSEHNQSVPKFVKIYADVWSEAIRAISRYCQEVKKGEFPAPEHTYALPEKELSRTLMSLRLMNQDQCGAQSSTTAISQELQKKSAG